ncbi:Transposase, type 1 [Cinara cedri]|uniref:Transposase, type 1 n=1 Tax=Cinara cedri TaxID=506608 RepID=A0A5E4N4F3_9HEMI|nr:Transposase, type 1 [Cinara cedri]
MELSNEFQISFGLVQTKLTTDLDMRRVAAKFVPKLLSDEQKENRKRIATDLLERSESDEFFLKSIITGDETWVYGYDPETKVQSSQWKTPDSPRPKKARQVRSQVKVMLTVFSTTKVLFIMNAVRRKRPEFKESGSWKWHHDNAPAHSVHVVQQFLAKHDIPVVSQPPYSPDLAPCDYFLFPKIKIALKGKRFQDVDEIKQNATEQLRGVSKNDFQRCFQK